LLKLLNGVKIDGAMWDVMRKPSIAPKQIKGKAELANIIANGRYMNTRLSQETLVWLQTNACENLEMYEARLLHDCTVEKPQHYFQRRSIPRLDSEILDYASELWDAGQLILEARRNDRWQKHPGSCMAYGTPCKYLGICSGTDNHESARWQPKENTHAELGDGFDKNTITYSSVRCFQTCPKKYYYTYELGIERIDEEEREALLFGHIWHIGLEAYWRALMPEENENGNDTRNECVEKAIPF
jgi:hypothetical protein